MDELEGAVHEEGEEAEHAEVEDVGPAEEDLLLHIARNLWGGRVTIPHKKTCQEAVLAGSFLCCKTKINLIQAAYYPAI